MELKVLELSVDDQFAESGKSSICGSVDVRLDIPGGQGGGRIGVTFEHEGARELTFNQLEKLVLDKVRSSLT